jgi:GntR family transcriptional regulator, rspAB operon transcriptional repressor
MSPILNHRSLPESVHEILRARILNNDLPAGTALVELNLAEEFGVSRTTIRAAFRELQAERLIEIAPRRGTTVTRMSYEASIEVCFARYALETAGLEDVLRHSRADLVRQMSDAVASMTEAADKGDVVGVVDADTVLHRAIIAAAGNQVMIDMWQSLNGQMGALMRSTLDRQGIVDLAAMVRWHERLVRAFKRKDPDGVVKALHEHYVTGAVSKVSKVSKVKGA